MSEECFGNHNEDDPCDQCKNFNTSVCDNCCHEHLFDCHFVEMS